MIRRFQRRRPTPTVPASTGAPTVMPAVKVQRCRCHAPWCEDWRADCPCGKGWRAGTLRTAHSVAMYHSKQCVKLSDARFRAVPFLPSRVR